MTLNTKGKKLKKIWKKDMARKKASLFSMQWKTLGN